MTQRNPRKSFHSVLFACLLTASVSLPSTAGATSALQGYISIKGQKQGQFKGDVVVNPHLKNDWLLIHSLGYEVTAPRDPNSGLPSGKRLHKPVTITKDWGGASTQIYTALITNERLTTVLIDFYQFNQDGQSQLAYSIKMDNALISSVNQSTAASQNCGPNGLCPLQELEAVSFTFQKIEVTNHLSNTSVVDDWSSNGVQ